METAQTLAWPNPHVYVPTEPTAAKVKSIPATGVLAVLSDIFEVLNLGSHQRRCDFAVPAAAKRDFSSFSLATGPLVLSCGFSPTSACVPPTRACSRGCQSTGARQAGRSQGGNWGKWTAQVGGCWGKYWKECAHQVTIGVSWSPRRGVAVARRSDDRDT